MSLFEQQFSSSVLEVVVPDASLEFPSPGANGDTWYSKLKADGGERNTAFFDEQLEFILVLRTPGSSADLAAVDTAPRPSADLLSFYAHIQVVLEASYLQSAPAPPPSSGLASARLGMPPVRTASLKVDKRRPPNLHPSIFPPQTPHPTPSVGGNDRQYVSTEGTPLSSKTWGEDDEDNFSLLWSKQDKIWLALFKMTVGVAFLRLNYSDPLICLTVSTTLRDKKLDMVKGRQTLGRLLDAAGGSTESAPSSPVKLERDLTDIESQITGLEEVDLFEGLRSGPTFMSEGNSTISLPTSRLGVTTRRQEFSLSTVSALPSFNIPTAAPRTNQTLRKAFRKTLQTASGFRVRMRTVFVPYVLLPSSGQSDKLDEEDAPAAGMAESTVMLCVELENLGEAGGFAIEAVDIDVSGDGARTTLIGWEAKKTAAESFPVRLGAYEQHNLLYAVSFVRSADSDETAPADLQRAVAIYVHGRPYDIPFSEDEEPRFPAKQFSSRWNCVLDLDPRRNRQSEDYSGVDFGGGGPGGVRDVLPEPASPFPTAGSPQTATVGSFAAQQQVRSQTRPSTPNVPVNLGAVAGSKRHTLSAISVAAGQKRHTIGTAPPLPATAGGGGGTPVNYRSSTSMLNPAFQSERELRDRDHPATAGGLPKRGTSPLPPSLVVQQAQAQARSPTTYGFPYGGSVAGKGSPAIHIGGGSDASSDSGAGGGQFASMQQQFSVGLPPPTPAYPAYPNAPATPSPFSQVPVATSQTGVGPSVEIRRDRGQGGGQGVGVPPTPGPRVPAPYGGGGAPALNLQTQIPHGAHEGGQVTYSPVSSEDDKLVISIGLVHVPRARHDNSADTDSSEDEDDESGPKRLHPLDRFALDVFVFNQSSWTRRLELAVPSARQKRKGRPISTGYFPPVGGQSDTTHVRGEVPGIVALENRVRVGPLRPATCQSVRMQFMAMTPGVHPVETLTLTDVETGYSVSLRQIMDVVVHAREKISS